MYIDKLTDSSNEIDYMMRGIGIAQESIKYVIDNEFNNEPLMLYKHIFDGKSQTFDLTNGKPAFDMKNNMSISTRQHFERRIKTNYVEGKCDEYFNYANVIEEDYEDIESDETVINKIIEEEMKERNKLIVSYKDKPLKMLFNGRFSQSLILISIKSLMHNKEQSSETNCFQFYHQMI